jgi:hypothetical protein
MTRRDWTFLITTVVLAALSGLGTPWNLPLCMWAGWVAAAAAEVRA